MTDTPIITGTAGEVRYFLSDLDFDKFGLTVQESISGVTVNVGAGRPGYSTTVLTILRQTYEVDVNPANPNQMYVRGPK